MSPPGVTIYFLVHPAHLDWELQGQDIVLLFLFLQGLEPNIDSMKNYSIHETLMVLILLICHMLL